MEAVFAQLKALEDAEEDAAAAVAAAAAAAAATAKHAERHGGDGGAARDAAAAATAPVIVSSTGKYSSAETLGHVLELVRQHQVGRSGMLCGAGRLRGGWDRERRSAHGEDPCSSC